jgi:hypothetical protein
MKALPQFASDNGAPESAVCALRAGIPVTRITEGLQLIDPLTANN